MKKSITITIPAFNAQEFLEECLDSVQNQTYFQNFDNYKILLVIDSCDSTEKVALQIKDKFKNLFIYRTNKNVGSNVIKNSVINLIDTEFCINFGADDVMHPIMIEECFKEFENNNKNNMPILVGHDGILFAQKSIFEIVGGYMPWRCAADTEIKLRIERIFGAKIKKIHQHYHYRTHKNQITKSGKYAKGSDYRNQCIAIMQQNIIPNKIIPVAETIHELSIPIPVGAIHELPQYSIFCGVASFPAREKSLGAVVKSIINQVDYLYVYLNEYEKIPEYLLNNDKIIVYESQNEIGDLGDVGKFYFMFKNNIQGYCFTIDDDLIYAQNYVQLMINNLNNHDNIGIFTLHGRNIHEFPVKSYYNDKATHYRCLHGNKSEVQVQFTGTGVMAWHSKCIKFVINDFTHKNMADIFVSIIAHKKNIPIFVPVHSNLIKVSGLNDIHETIWANCHNNDSTQSEIVNNYFAKLKK